MKDGYKEQLRKHRISEIVITLKELLHLGKDYDKGMFVNEICLRYGVTDRKAKEYIKLAEFRLDRDNKGN